MSSPSLYSNAASNFLSPIPITPASLLFSVAIAGGEVVEDGLVFRSDRRRSMGRGRVQLRWIENKLRRQVTFSKRRAGLLKKAHEISVLCNVEVALILFSGKGKLYEYSTDSRMDRILERYERYCSAEKAVLTTEPKPLGNLCHECGKLKNMIEALQKSQCHLMGEKLDTLSLKELQHLELLLETTVKHIRSQRSHLLLDSIDELQRKEKSLLEHNSFLEKKITENENVITIEHTKWNHQKQAQASSAPTAALPSLIIGTSRDNSSEEDAARIPLARINSSSLPPWMLRLPS